MVRRLILLVALGSCTVEREPPPSAGDPRPVAGPATEPTASPASAPAEATAPDARAQLDAIVRPEAKAADAPPLPEPPPPKPRREAGVTLLEPGAQPRAIAARSPAPGAPQSLALHLGMDVAMQLGKQAVPAQTVPGLDVTLRLEPRDDAERVHVSVTDVRVEPLEDGSARVREAVQEAAARLAKIEGDAALETPGSAIEALDVDLTDDSGLQPTFAGFRDAYAHLFVQLPAEPIGPGARWQVVTHGELSGLPVQRVATYTLKRRDGDTLDLDVAIEEHFTTAGKDAPQPVDGPVRAVAYDASGEGDVRIDLARVAPTNGSLESESTTRVHAAFGGTPTEVQMILETRVTLAERQ